jgi:hypothetical protein
LFVFWSGFLKKRGKKKNRNISHAFFNLIWVRLRGRNTPRLPRGNPPPPPNTHTITTYINHIPPSSAHFDHTPKYNIFTLFSASQHSVSTYIQKKYVPSWSRRNTRFQLRRKKTRTQAGKGVAGKHSQRIMDSQCRIDNIMNTNWPYIWPIRVSGWGRWKGESRWLHFHIYILQQREWSFS